MNELFLTNPAPADRLPFAWLPPTPMLLPPRPLGSFRQMMSRRMSVTGLSLPPSPLWPLTLWLLSQVSVTEVILVSRHYMPLVPSSCTVAVASLRSPRALLCYNPPHRQIHIRILDLPFVGSIGSWCLVVCLSIFWSPKYSLSLVNIYHLKHGGEGLGWLCLVRGTTQTKRRLFWRCYRDRLETPYIGAL